MWEAVAFVGGMLFGVVMTRYFGRRALKRLRDVWPTGMSPEDWVGPKKEGRGDDDTL